MRKRTCTVVQITLAADDAGSMFAAAICHAAKPLEQAVTACYCSETLVYIMYTRGECIYIADDDEGSITKINALQNNAGGSIAIIQRLVWLAGNIFMEREGYTCIRAQFSSARRCELS